MRYLSPLLVGVFWLQIGQTASWPDFRGPWQNGHAAAPGDTNRIGLPLHWSETNNVTWKTPLPHRGWSTPVIWGRQIWLTTATPDGREFFALCVAVDSGQVIFNRRLFQCETPEPLGNNLNGYASPSPVIESDRVYVHFGSYGTACLDTRDFKVLWRRDDLPCRHYRGPGSSPVIVGDLLILTMDGVDQHYLVALDKRTGQTVWRTDRTAEWNDLGPDGRPMGEGDYRKAFSTPLLVEVNGASQVLSVGSKAAYGYDPQTGRELWRLNHPAFSGASRPLFDGHMAYLWTGHGKGELLAVELGRAGRVVESNVVWRVTRGIPRMPSAVLVDDLLFMVSDNGIASCLEAATGQELWQERLGGEYAASLLYAEGRVYAFSQQGRATVLQPGREFQVLATNTLADGFMASPAVAGQALILRTKTHLYRIEQTPSRPN